MILLLHGPDSYQLRQRLSFYREGFKKKYDPQGYNVITLDGAKLTTEDFRKRAGQVGFLSQKRFLVVDNLITKNKQKKIFEQLVEYLTDEWSDENVLIFIEEQETTTTRKKKTSRGTNPLEAFLNKKATVEEFALLSGAELTQWVASEVKRRGGRIDAAAVRELAALVGPDLWNMVSEIEKLINFRGADTITVGDVTDMVRAVYDENIFHLTDALASKNSKQSYALLHDQLASGSPALYILTMLIRQFRILLQVQDVLQREPNEATVASRLKLHPYVAQKAVRDARRFTSEELQNIYRQLMEIDVALKTSQQDPRLLFDLLVADICQPTTISK